MKSANTQLRSVCVCVCARTCAREPPDTVLGLTWCYPNNLLLPSYLLCFVLLPSVLLKFLSSIYIYHAAYLLFRYWRLRKDVSRLSLSSFFWCGCETDFVPTWSLLLCHSQIKAQPFSSFLNTHFWLICSLLCSRRSFAFFSFSMLLCFRFYSLCLWLNPGICSFAVYISGYENLCLSALSS